MKKIFARIAGLTALALPAVSLAQEAVRTGDGSSLGLKAALAIGAGLGLGLAVFGGSLGQGKAAAAALEGISRNPEASGKVLMQLILSLALIESLVIYALVVALLLQGKI